MNNIGRKPVQRSRNQWSGDCHRKTADNNRWAFDNGDPAVAGALGGGGNHEDLMAARQKSVNNAEDRVGNAIDGGEKGLRDNGNPHLATPA